MFGPAPGEISPAPESRTAATRGTARRVAREREQIMEAYAVQVVLGERTAGERDDVYGEPLSDCVKRLAVMVVNPQLLHCHESWGGFQL
jgi:hypothetical protein